MICKKCGKKLAEEDRFCSSCGTVIEKLEEVESGESTEEFCPEKEDGERVVSDFAIKDFKWDLEGFPTEDEGEKKTDREFVWEPIMNDEKEEPEVEPEIEEEAEEAEEEDTFEIEDVPSFDWGLGTTARFDRSAIESDGEEVPVIEHRAGFTDTMNDIDKPDSNGKIDRFYTFNQKNAEFQKLLDREYEKMRSRLKEEAEAEEILNRKNENLENARSKWKKVWGTPEEEIPSGEEADNNLKALIQELDSLKEEVDDICREETELAEEKQAELGISDEELMDNSPIEKKEEDEEEIFFAAIHEAEEEPVEEEKEEDEEEIFFAAIHEAEEEPVEEEKPDGEEEKEEDEEEIFFAAIHEAEEEPVEEEKPDGEEEKEEDEEEIFFAAIHEAEEKPVEEEKPDGEEEKEEDEEEIFFAAIHEAEEEPVEEEKPDGEDGEDGEEDDEEEIFFAAIHDEESEPESEIDSIMLPTIPVSVVPEDDCDNESNDIQEIPEEKDEKPEKEGYCEIFDEDLEEEKKEKKSGKGKIIFLDILIIILVVVIIITSILVFAGDSMVGIKLNEAIQKTVTCITGKEPEPDLKKVAKDSQTEMGKIIEKVKPKDGRIVGIGEKKDLRFNQDGEYAVKGIENANPYQDSMWFTDDKGETVTYNQVAVRDVIGYYSDLVVKLADGSNDILNYVQKGSPLEETLKKIKKKEPDFKINSLMIGEMIAADKDYYMLAEVDSEGGKSAIGSSGRYVIHLVAGDKSMKIVEIAACE